MSQPLSPALVAPGSCRRRRFIAYFDTQDVRWAFGAVIIIKAGRRLFVARSH
jgi:hypothetical protein